MKTDRYTLAVYKISGSPGILTPKIADGLPDFSTWEYSPDYHVLHLSVLRFMAWMPIAHRFWRTPRFIDMEIRWMPMVFFLIYTLYTGILPRRKYTRTYAQRRSLIGAGDGGTNDKVTVLNKDYASH